MASIISAKNVDESPSLYAATSSTPSYIRLDQPPAPGTRNNQRYQPPENIETEGQPNSERRRSNKVSDCLDIFCDEFICFDFFSALFEVIFKSFKCCKNDNTECDV